MPGELPVEPVGGTGRRAASLARAGIRRTHRSWRAAAELPRAGPGSTPRGVPAYPNVGPARARGARRDATQRPGRPSDRVLDMGTGSGVNAILAATIAADVLGVDVDPASVLAARR